MSGQAARILVVDDQPEVLQSMLMALEGFGYEVHTASNALEALQEFQNRFFHLAIIDQMMPGPKGNELAACLKGYEPDVPVVMISAFDLKKFPGVDYFCQKPVAPSELHRLIEEIFHAVPVPVA
ncbi:MAG TPA: response regulator [Verrucomicrobiae bacterium]|jgi:CheY-like chemotaxis protein